MIRRSGEQEAWALTSAASGCNEEGVISVEGTLAELVCSSGKECIWDWGYTGCVICKSAMDGKWMHLKNTPTWHVFFERLITVNTAL